MASAVTNTLKSTKVQSAIRARATTIAKKKVIEATKAIRARLNRAGPAIKKDVIEAFVIPGASAVVGAVAADVVLDRFNFLSGAKGDIAKISAGITVGVFGRKLFKNSPYIHHAALGVVVVNGYKLATRLINRGVAGVGLKGLLNDSNNQDLAGYADQDGTDMEAVNIMLTDGSYVSGFQDSSGTLFDEYGNLIVAESSIDAEPPGVSGIPFYDAPEAINRVRSGSSVVN